MGFADDRQIDASVQKSSLGTESWSEWFGLSEKQSTSFFLSSRQENNPPLRKGMFFINFKNFSFPLSENIFS